jgi:hypothetical protein
MAPKRTIHERCPHCGKVQARRDGQLIKVNWCDCQKIPGPPSPPKTFHEHEVDFVCEFRQEIERLRSVIRKLREEEWRGYGRHEAHEREWETEEQESEREKRNRDRKQEWDVVTEEMISGYGDED